jgi:hypothetical protein
MRFIPTAVHGIADYVVGLIVLGLPFYFGWSGVPRACFVLLGIYAIVYSLLTDYEAGLFRLLPMRFHLLLDAIFGFGMLSLPYLTALPPVGRPIAYAIGVLALVLASTTMTRAAAPDRMQPLKYPFHEDPVVPDRLSTGREQGCLER